VMETKLEKEVRFLKVYAVVATLFCAVFLLSAFAIQSKKQKFEEIDVERINVVEKDGKLKMVISNSERQHPGLMEGKSIPRRRPAGLLFFNDVGDECGGLYFYGNEKNGQALGLSFDKFRSDQTIQVQYREGSDRKYYAGLVVWDRNNDSVWDMVARSQEIDKMPNGPEKEATMKAFRSTEGWGIERVSVGKDRDQAAAIRLADPKGRMRIKMSVDATGTPRLEFLDENRKVIYSLPPQESKGAK
jgi:hypothetical protein